MRLNKFIIKNFRSFKNSKELELNSNYVTFTGQNNCGKSNILRALNLFFNGVVDNNSYNSEVDMHKQTIDNHSSERTNITCFFSLNRRKEKHIIQRLEKLKKDGLIKEYNPESIQISYIISRSNVTQVQIVDPTTGRRSQSKEITDFFENAIRRSINFVYIPAIKDFKNFIDKDISYELLKRIFNTWGGKRNPNAQKLKTNFENIKKGIEEIIFDANDNITDILKEQTGQINRFIFNLPFKDIIEFLSYLPISLDDGIITDILQKGSGVQAITLYSILRYLDRYAPSNKFASAQYIWAIEEPETFLHPNAQKQLYSAFKEYANDTQILCTTHSYYFLNTENVKSNYLLNKLVIENNYTETDIVKQEKNYWEPFMEILGDFKPSFIPTSGSDKYYLFLEGALDIRYVEKAIELFPELKTEFEKFELVDSNGSEIVKKATDALIYRLKSFVLVDGDNDGQSYYNQLKNKGYEEGKNLFIIEKKGFSNPTMEALVTQLKFEKFKKSMPKDAYDYWYSQLRIFTVFNNVPEKPPVGWNKDGLKNKLCDYMELNGEKRDFEDLKNVLLKVVHSHYYE